jgi:hypothetical protein
MAQSLLALPLLLVPLSACASADGPWPSLMTAEEAARAPQAAGVPPKPVQIAQAAPEALTPATPGQLMLIRVGEQRRAFEFAKGRYERQLAAFTAARKAVSGAPGASNVSWTTAQLELSRLNQSVAGISDVISAGNGLAGDIAMQAASGADVSAALRQLGSLLAEARSLQDSATAAAKSAAAGLSR